jgi:hypothetical protein
MRKLFQEIQNRIQTIDFNELWNGFAPCEFALYNDETVFFETNEIPKTDLFLGNTTIKYEDKQIAIWKVEKEDLNDLDLIAASIIHEMFHSYQLIEGENRFFNDIVALSYPIEYQNLNMKFNESKLLVSALEENDYQIKESFFKKFTSMRQKRFSLIGDDSLYEKSIETIEGSAEYVALKSLKALNFESYKRQLDKSISWIATINENFLDIRRTSYYTGALICIVADDLHIDYKKKLEPNLKSNYDLMTENFILRLDHEVEISEFIKIQEMIDERNKSIKGKVNEIMSHHNVGIFKGDFYIRGYDPMNMRRYEKYVYHKHFLGIHENGKTEFVMGEIVTETDGIDFSRFSTYYKIKMT